MLYNFLVTRIVRVIRAKNYEKLLKFVEVTAKILLVLFFRTRCSYNCRLTGSCIMIHRLVPLSMTLNYP